MVTAKNLLTIDEYEQMLRDGTLTEDDRVELIEGEIVAKSPIGDRHYDSVFLLGRALTRQMPDDLGVAVQSPIRLPSRSEPEPDIAVIRVVRSPPGVPTAPDILLIAEVSDSTLRYDRDVKLPLYASAGIPEMWIVDLGADEVYRYTDPFEGTYQHRQRFVRGQTVTSAMLPTVAVPVDTALGLRP